MEDKKNLTIFKNNNRNDKKQNCQKKNKRKKL